MDTLIFQMPGPAAFIDTLEQDLRAGRNILLLLPSTPFLAIRDVLSRRVSENGLWDWQSIDLSNFDDGMNPLEVIKRRMSKLDIHDIASLIQHIDLQGKVFWVEGIKPQHLKSWKSFLAAYEHMCRNSGGDHPLFCVAVWGIDESPTASIGPACVYRQWRGILNHLDMELLIAHIVRNQSMHPLETRLTISLCAELAGTDFSLASQLAECTIPTLFDVEPVLRQFAKQKGWTLEGIDNPAWRSGQIDEVDGKDVIHSAYLALRGEHKELQRRLWRAEVRVLFPFIEEQRVLFTDKLQDLLRPRMPIELALTRVDDYRDLEIGPILWLTKSKLDGATLRLLTALKDMRIALAHLQPISVLDWTIVQDSLKVLI
jgi:hypothetical protein